MFDNVSQNEVIEVAGFNLMAGAGVLSQPVIGLADVIRLVNRLPHFSGKAILSSPAYLLIAYLHGFPAGSAVDKTMEQVIERTAIPLHDGRAAINQLLHSIPLFPADNRLVAVLDNFPLIAGNEIYRIGTNCLLMAFTNYMVAFVNRVAEHFANHRTTPRIIANLGFNRHLDAGDRDFALDRKSVV